MLECGKDFAEVPSRVELETEAFLQEQSQTVQSLLVFKEMTEDAGIRAAVISGRHVCKGGERGRGADLFLR